MLRVARCGSSVRMKSFLIDIFSICVELGYIPPLTNHYSVMLFRLVILFSFVCSPYTSLIIMIP